MVVGFGCLALNLFGVLVLHEGISAEPAGSFGWIMLLFSPVPYVYLGLCALGSKNRKKEDILSFGLLILGYIVMLTISSSKGAFIGVILMWLIVRFVQEGDFKINWKQLAGILVLVFFLVTFFAGFATGLRYLWINKEFSLNNVIKVMYDPSMRVEMGVQWLSGRMSSFDPLIAGINSSNKMHLQDILPLTDVFKMIINNLVPGDVFDPSSLQLSLGQMAVVMLENPDSYYYFRAGKYSHAGNWGGIFNLAYCYAGWLGGLTMIFVFALLMGIIYCYLGRAPSTSKHFYQAILLTVAYAIWQAGNIDTIIPIYLIYFIQGLVIINVGRVMLGLNKVLFKDRYPVGGGIN